MRKPLIIMEKNIILIQISNIMYDGFTVSK